MKINKTVRNWEAAIGFAIGAAVVAYGLYKLLREKSPLEEMDLEPAGSAPEANPYYDPRPHRRRESTLSKSQLREHRPTVGNSPGERNQIGGRASGKQARY